MIRTVLSAVAFVFLCSTAHAQFKAGSLELGLNAAFGSMTESHTGSSSYYGTSSSSSTTTVYGVLAVTPAVYLTDGFSFEPELALTLISPDKGSSENTFSAIANLSYTYLAPGSSLAPFVRAGYGMSDGLTAPGFTGPIKTDDNLSVSIANIGGGVKFLVDPHVCIRMELNYEHQSYSNNYGDYSNGTIRLQFGLAVLLGGDRKSEEK